jgi:hypothetical protein
MSSIYKDVLSEEELYYINNHPQVLLAKSSLDSQSSGMVYFSVPITSLIRDTLQSRFGLQLPVDSQIPMRWIKGDIAPHVDVGSSKFENTYLMYLNDAPGEFIVDSQSYPIQSNTGFVFNEGLSHETKYTENVPRLLVGPMNEQVDPVGATVTFYYPTESDALANRNVLAQYGNYTILPVSGYNNWRIASTSTGPSPQNILYNVNDTLNGNGLTDFYYLYPSALCFLEGTTILCQEDGSEKYLAVETLKPGTLVKTSLDGYKPVVLIGKGTIQNPGDDERIENRLYKCSTSNYPELKNDLYITGGHSILEFPITEKQKEDIIKHVGRLFVTDKKYRVMACIDERAEPWNSKGEYSIWHFALENNDEKMNYGVYANGGLLVETCNIDYLKQKSNMEFS